MFVVVFNVSLGAKSTYRMFQNFTSHPYDTLLLFYFFLHYTVFLGRSPGSIQFSMVGFSLGFHNCTQSVFCVLMRICLSIYLPFPHNLQVILSP